MVIASGQENCDQGGGKTEHAVKKGPDEKEEYQTPGRDFHNVFVF